MRICVLLTFALASSYSVEAVEQKAPPKAPAVVPPKQSKPTPTPGRPSSPPVSPSPKPGTSSTCFYQGYVPTFDAGPDEDILKRRSLAGRIEIEKRVKGGRTPGQFGRCEFATKLEKPLDLRPNPTIENVLTNVNRAGGIPKWFGVKKDCTATPGLEKRALTDAEVKAKVKSTNWRTGKITENASHNIDHIWELNLMKLFFESVLPTDKKPSGTLTCADFDASFIVPGSKPADKPIQQLYARMPQALIGKTATMDTLEFAGTSVELNSKKGRILVPKEADRSGTSLSSAAHGYTLRNTKDKLHALRTVGTAFDFMNDASIAALFNRAQTRLRDYLKEVDTQLATSKVNLSRPDFKWATEFQTWMGRHLDASCNDSYEWVQSVLREVKKEISKMPQQTAVQKADRQIYETYLITFMNSKYSKKAHYKLNWKA